MNMKIPLKDLRQVMDRLMTHLEREGPVIELPHEFYWNIPSAVRYDSYNEPKTFTVGQLSDDWAELQRIGSGQVDPLGYGLVWLGSLLMAVGETVVD
jgi:hypothetical protein